MNKSTLHAFSKLSVILLCLLGLTELALALWTVFDSRYRSLAYSLADVGYIDLWILRYLSLCLLASSIITLVMCLVLIWGLCSAHVFLFIASTMIAVVLIGELIISILTFASKYQTRLTLIEQLPKLVITYRQGSDERALRALDFLQSTFRCCGADGRLSFQNNVPSSCNMYSIGCSTRTIYFLNACLDALAFVLLFAGLIKLFLVVYFYAFLCLSRKPRAKRSEEPASFESSSSELPPRRTLALPRLSQREHANQYEPSSGEQSPTRKLSAISERTEGEGEPDATRFKQQRPRAPRVRTRRAGPREDEDDSGVEYSSASEKSFDDTSSTAKSASSLGFSKVFITSVSRTRAGSEQEARRPFISTLAESRMETPRSILKKFHRRSSPESLYSQTARPQPIPRLTRMKPRESLY